MYYHRNVVNAMKGWSGQGSGPDQTMTNCGRLGTTSNVVYNGLRVTRETPLGPGWLGKGGFLLLPEPHSYIPESSPPFHSICHHRLCVPHMT